MFRHVSVNIRSSVRHSGDTHFKDSSTKVAGRETKDFTVVSDDRDFPIDYGCANSRLCSCFNRIGNTDKDRGFIIKNSNNE